MVTGSGSAATMDDDSAATVIGYGYLTVLPAAHSPHANSSSIYDKKNYHDLYSGCLAPSSSIVGDGIFPSTRADTNPT